MATEFHFRSAEPLEHSPPHNPTTSSSPSLHLDRYQHLSKHLNQLSPRNSVSAMFFLFATLAFAALPMVGHTSPLPPDSPKDDPGAANDDTIKHNWAVTGLVLAMAVAFIVLIIIFSYIIRCCIRCGNRSRDKEAKKNSTLPHSIALQDRIVSNAV